MRDVRLTFGALAVLATAGCATAKPGSPAVDDTFFFHHGSHVTQIRVTPRSIEGYRFSYLRDGEWMNGPLTNFHLTANAVDSKSGAHLDVLLASGGLHVKGYWHECLIDLMVRPKSIAGNLCGTDVTLEFDGESYVGELGSAWGQRGVTLHVPRIMATRPPSEFAFALALVLTTRGPM